MTKGQTIRSSVLLHGIERQESSFMPVYSS